MSAREVSRLELIQRVESKSMSQVDAAERLGLTTRQVRRLQSDYRAKGAPGLISARRGQASNNRLSKTVKKKALTLLQKRYQGFGPTLAHEKLEEEHNCYLSLESLRQLMIKEDLWQSRRVRKPVIHPMRERRAAWGELIQIDGSPHHWFEERGPACTLLVFIDDATGALCHLQFVKAETTWSYLDGMKSYLHHYGKPCALYSDQYSVFKVNRETHQGDGVTQFARAMQQLDIQLICAHSPQAKGRVERMNQLLQDRLVKELRLLKISSMEQANQMLPAFMESINNRFAVAPRSDHNAHRPLRKSDHLDQILTLQTTRVLSKNLTLSHNNLIYQIKTPRPAYAMRGGHVLVCEERNGAVSLLYKGKLLDYQVHHRKTSQARVVDTKEIDQALKKDTARKASRSAPSLKPNHPWRRTMFPASQAKSAPTHATNI